MIFKTATGKALNYAWCGVAFDNNLYVGVKDLSLVEAMQLFTNAAETETLTFFPDDQSEDFNFEKAGFTRFVSIQVNQNDQTIIVGMGREYAE